MSNTESPKTETAPAAAETVAVKGKQVSTTIPADLYAALEDHRWDVRLSMTDLVRKAIEDYAAAHKVGAAKA